MSTIMTYEDLINQWFERSHSESDIFTKFMFLYISFISFLTQVKNKDTDRATINSLKRSQDARDYYLRLIQQDAALEATINKLISELRKQSIRNVTRSTDPNWTGRDGVLRDEEDWENLVEYWYRVRNNLFHGHKAPDFERDRRLIEYAYLTLTPFMEYFIAHRLLWEFD